MGERAHFFAMMVVARDIDFFETAAFCIPSQKCSQTSLQWLKQIQKKRNTTTFTGMTERKQQKNIQNIDQNSDTSSRWGEGDGREPPPLLLSAVWLQLSAVPPPHVRRPDLSARWFVEGPNGEVDFQVLMEDLANQLLLVHNLYK